jgi:hypothetical protein
MDKKVEINLYGIVFTSNTAKIGEHFTVNGKEVHRWEVEWKDDHYVITIAPKVSYSNLDR